MKHLLLAAAFAAVLSACSSGVKLNDVPVEDRTGTTASTGTGTGQGNGDAISQRPVQPIDLGKSGADAASPAGARIVYFDFDSYSVRADGQTVIERNAAYLKANGARKVNIEGHTDERGGREYNLALGQKRAEAVRRAMGLLGVADSQMEAVSFGKEKPANPGHDEAAMAENRRAEITYR